MIGVGHRTGQAIELGHHQHVASATRCECRPESWSVSVLPRESVVHVDPLGVHPHGHQRISLCGEVLLVGAATGVRRENLAHPPTVSYELPPSGRTPGGFDRDTPTWTHCPAGSSLRRPVQDPFEAKAPYTRQGGPFGPPCRTGTACYCVLLTTADNQPLNSAVGGNGQQYAQLSGRRHRQRSTEDAQ